MNGVFLLIFSCFWSTIVILFDSHIGRTLWNQFESRNYPAITGQITHSELTRSRGRKGRTSYGVAIRYHYVVDDRSLDGTQFRYNANSSSDSTWAARVVSEHPVGSQTRVFYNPHNPQDAVLATGVDGSDLMLMLFLMPFNIIMLGLWTWLGGWLRERIFKPVAGGVRILTEGSRTSVRLPEYAAMVWCMAAIGGLSFVSVFLFGLPSGFHPSVPAASVVLFVVAGGGVCAYWWQWQKIHSGDDDLIIDEGSRTMELPETYGRKNRVTVALAGVENLTVEVIEHHGSKGGTSYTYAPTLWLRDGDAGSQKLADWSDKMKAEAFTDWLRKRLGVSNVPPIRTTMRTGTGSDPLRRSNG